ncbi:hypothetical protein GDO81_029952 [Engystomops pustulosus]|uniref:Uncharacterized protein n=1 Tax=Engystomops pustulosus TaxID=76066 RepID=A0AAV6ZBC7_ENGPU|nr:hypothetical protein GDO81_029952 [Engystomops pustulosus]
MKTCCRYCLSCYNTIYLTLKIMSVYKVCHVMTWEILPSQQVHAIVTQIYLSDPFFERGGGDGHLTNGHRVPWEWTQSLTSIDPMDLPSHDFFVNVMIC